MSFEIKYLVRTTPSVNQNAPETWAYNASSDGSNDTLATVKGSGYFDAYKNAFKIGDLIFARANDETSFLEVTAVSPNVTTVEQTANGLDGNNVANVSDKNTTGGIPVIFTIDTAGGATDNTDVTVDNKVRVIDVTVQNNGAGTTSDTIQVKNSTNNITDAIDISGGDKTIARAGEVDDANATIAASGTLRVAETDGGGSDSPATTVTVYAVRVA